uniref:Putative polyprotein n=1 Tax=Albugo laibachii Nc14 TaxID=890382 RepID=F0WYI1_9STRA|nr:putative polyprotein [Albugo laibachii Nc14]|eukprot:CCA26538.1 putative polyprotein [Albugo laibachii Nc14]
MSPNSRNAVDELLGDNNYFTWEFNARMKQMKKGLLNHIDESESISEDRTALAIWKVNDLKALASLQAMVRGSKELAKTPRIHNGKWWKYYGTLLKFDELCLSIQACGDVMSMDEQLIILLGSLSDEYDPIIRIIENVQGIDLFQAKEMLHREHALLVKKETGEIALKAIKQSERFDA